MAGALVDFAGISIIQGASFAAALSLVVFAGAELFTGNIFVMLAGIKLGTVKPRDAWALCTFCYFGNLAGSILVALLFCGTGFMRGSVWAETISLIKNKTDPYAGQLLVRGILCNVLVCLAVWCVYRMKSESGKLVMIFWCIYLFFVCGFEHCIANMTLFGLGVLGRGEGLASLGLIFMNLAMSTIGNIIGGLGLSYAYWVIGRKTV
jgi:nitrite transporter NirC